MDFGIWQVLSREHQNEQEFTINTMSLPSPLIGILGGMGPQAGLDMAEKLIAMTKAECDQDHLPFILFSLPEGISDRTAFLLGKTDANPAQVIAEQFEKMAEMGVTIAVMACNTAYAGPIFDKALELLQAKGVRLRILHLIDETIAHIKSRYPQVSRVGLLATQGTYKTRLYDQALEVAGLQVVIPDERVRVDDIHAALYGPSFGIKTCDGPVTGKAMDRVRSAIDHVIQQGAEAVILGCTELPLAVREERINGIPILDPAKIMAEKLVLETSPAKLVQST